MNKLFLLATLLPVTILAKNPPKPNIIHIMVDDLGWQDIASHKIDGKPVYETPHLDRLTKIGRRFTQAYSPAPTCAPSRVSFLRGQYPIKTGIYHVQGGRLPRPWRNDTPLISPYYTYGLADSEPTIADIMKQAGYFTGHVGKWHAGGKSAGYPFPLDQGFDFGFSEKQGRHKYYNDPELWNDKDGNKNQFFGSWSQMKPNRITNFATNSSDDPFQLNEEERPFDKPHELAMGFIKKHKNKPFFLHYCPYYVHGPIQTRDKKRFDKYLKKMGYDFPKNPEPLDKGLPGHTNPYYASMVDTVDYMIGEIMNYLEETDDPRNPGHKLIANTYLIVDSDNGGVHRYTDNAPLRGGKQRSYEGGVRIPFLIMGPNVPAGTICDTPINLVDLFPTFMTIAGLKKRPALELDGCDILAHLHGSNQQAFFDDGTQRESFIWFFPMDSHSSIAIRKGPWKLVRNLGVSGGGSQKPSTELYRIYKDDASMADIGETKDLSKQYPEIQNLLSQEIDSHLKKYQARMPYRNMRNPQITEAELHASPKVLSLDTHEDSISLSFETGANKAKIIEAELFYTLNPKPFDSTRGHREEWFVAPAKILDGRVEATLPPGATHAAFILRDEQNFMISSEPLPSYQEKSVGFNDSRILSQTYAWQPGLFALIKLAKKAKKSSKSYGLDSSQLDLALKKSIALTQKKSASEEQYAQSIFKLRSAIRNMKEIPETRNPHLNRFPTDPLF